MYDIAAGLLLESIDAHTDAVWSISLSPDKVMHHYKSRQTRTNLTFLPDLFVLIVLPSL